MAKKSNEAPPVPIQMVADDPVINVQLRDHWRTAPRVIVLNMEDFLRRGEHLPAVQYAVRHGYRVEPHDLPMTHTKQLDMLTDPAERSTYRTAHSDKLTDERRAVERLTGLAATGWWKTTRQAEYERQIAERVTFEAARKREIEARAQAIAEERARQERDRDIARATLEIDERMMNQ